MMSKRTKVSLTELGHYSGGADIAKGSFVLFATNLIGIIFVACLILLTQGYGKWKKAGLGLVIVLIFSITIIDPLHKSLYKLTVKSKVLALVVTLPNKYPHVFTGRGRIDAININYHGEILHVGIEGVVPTPSPTLADEEADEKTDEIEDTLQIAINLFQKNLEEILNTPTIVEVDLIPIDIISARSRDDYTTDPIKYISPQERDTDHSVNGINK